MKEKISTLENQFQRVAPQRRHSFHGGERPGQSSDKSKDGLRMDADIWFPVPSPKTTHSTAKATLSPAPRAPAGETPTQQVKPELRNQAARNMPGAFVDSAASENAKESPRSGEMPRAETAAPPKSFFTRFKERARAAFATMGTMGAAAQESLGSSFAQAKARLTTALVWSATTLMLPALFAAMGEVKAAVSQEMARLWTAAGAMIKTITDQLVELVYSVSKRVGSMLQQGASQFSHWLAKSVDGIIASMQRLSSAMQARMKQRTEETNEASEEKPKSSDGEPVSNN